MPAPRIATVPTNVPKNDTPQFLEGLTPAEHKAILSAAKHRRYAPNSVMINQGHPADYFFMMTKGLARFFLLTDDGKKLLFRWLGPGDAFGGRAVLCVPSSYLFSAETITATEVLAWPRSSIRALTTRYPRLLENALLIVSDQMSWHVSTHINLACHSARQRLAHVLVTLARTVGQPGPHGTLLQVTNDDLANAANVTPFTASRLTSEWSRSRALVKKRGQIFLRSPERLFLSVT